MSGACPLLRRAKHRLTSEAIIDTTVRVVKSRALEAVAKADVRIARELWTLTSGNFCHEEDHVLLLGRGPAPSVSLRSCSEWIAGYPSPARRPFACAAAASPIVSGPPWRPYRGY